MSEHAERVDERPPPPPGRVLNQLVATRTGQGAGFPAVVLLHGQPGSARDWHAVAPLIEADYDVIAPDRPGYGRTGGPATGFAGNADAVVALLDALVIPAAVVVGHSWGGGIALALAQRHPGRVTGVVLVSSIGPGESFGWPDRLLAAPILGESVAAATIGATSRVLGNARVQAWGHRYLPGPAGELVGVVTAMTGAGTGTTAWRSFVVEQRAMLAELEALGPGLGDVRTPTAILHGGADRVVPPDVARRLASAIPSAALRIIPGVGHLMPHDHAYDVAAAIRTVSG